VYKPLSRDAAQFIPYDKQATPDEIRAYQERIGSLIYPANALRIDIAYPTSLLARFMHNFFLIHTYKADHLIIYLRDYKWLSLMVNKNTGISDESIKIFKKSSNVFYDDNCAMHRSFEEYIF